MTATRRKKKQKSFIEEWDLIPIGAIGVVTWLLSWVWWNWREAVMDLSGYITPVQPFGTLGERIPFPGTARFTDLVLILLALIAIYVLQSGRWKTKEQGNILRTMVHGSAGMIAFRVFWDFWHWLHLNSGWFQETTFFAGKVAITFLVLSLACTPLVTLFGWTALNQLKKPLGNWGFGFVFLHFFLFSIDFGFLGDTFSASAVVKETIQKQYALIGFTGFLLLLPLFITSNKWSQKRLKKRWNKLHQLVYLINVLAVTHYIWVWLSKRALTQPIIYAVIVLFLLFIRIKPIKEWIRNFKKGRRQARKATVSV